MKGVDFAARKSKTTRLSEKLFDPEKLQKLKCRNKDFAKLK